MLNLSQIRDRLQDRRVGVVADKTQIHPNTVSAIRDGKNNNPSYSVLKSLSDYFEGEI